MYNQQKVLKMTYIHIEPKNIKSIKSAQRIVKILRSNRIVHDRAIITISVNGFDEYSVIVMPSDDDVKSWVCAILNGNLDEYNFYNDNWPTLY